MHDSGKLALSQIIQSALQEIGCTEELATIYRDIVPCPQPQLGQYAFKTFAIAKKAQKKPPELGAHLIGKMTSDKRIVKAEQAGPYVNVTLSPGLLASALSKELGADGLVVTLKADTKHRYLIEHSQANTHKELHIGHTRNTVLGDTLCRLLRHAGHHVHAENYHGDEGAHVAKCLWYLDKFGLKPPAGEDRGTWLGKVYVQAHAQIENASESEAEQYKTEISVVLKEIEERKGRFYDLWKETRQWSLELFGKVYNWLDVEFDSDRCESDVSEESFEIVQKYFKQGVFIKSEGAIGADLSDQNLGFCLLLKTDGRGLYATKDLALALRRFHDLKPDTCVYVVDNRQSYHFKQVFATLAKMGFAEAKRCYHLAYEMVETKAGAMSSRKGNIVPILQLMSELQSRAAAIISERYSAEWDTATISKTAEKVAIAAVRYGMIKVEPESKIVFDLEHWVTLEGNTGPYMQYVYARMGSLLRKLGDRANLSLEKINWAPLTHVSEQQLLSHLAAFNEQVDTASEKLKPNLFATYTYDLARKFNSFYVDCPINSEPDPQIQAARIGLVTICKDYLGTALDLLGIPRLERM